MECGHMIILRDFPKYKMCFGSNNPQAWDDFKGRHNFGYLIYSPEIIDIKRTEGGCGK